ncbi:MAG: hypothetical protein Q9205_001059 [Flavoplaca limonia]
MEPNLGDLRTNYELLQLLHYRNKNQHRRSTWWGPLCTLKACVQKLIREAEDASICLHIDPFCDLVSTTENMSEAQRTARTDHHAPSEAEDLDDVGQPIPRPAPSALLKSATTREISLSSDVSLSQRTSRTANRGRDTAEHKRLKKPLGTIDELFRALP